MTQDREAKSNMDDRPSKSLIVASIVTSILMRIMYALGSAVLIFIAVQVCRGSYGLPASIDISRLLDQHSLVVIGIPFASVAALLLISLTRALDGPMSFDLFGIKSEGAAATCIIWALLFLVISLTLRALW